MVTCLFSQQGHDLKTPMRTGASDQELRDSIGSIWKARADRYSEERFLAMNSSQGYHPDQHKKIEMITWEGSRQPDHDPQSGSFHFNSASGRRM